MPTLTDSPFVLATHVVRTLVAEYGFDVSSELTAYGVGKCAGPIVTKGWGAQPWCQSFMVAMARSLNVPQPTRAATFVTRVLRSTPDDFDIARLHADWDSGALMDVCSQAHAVYRGLSQANFDRSIVFLQFAYLAAQAATGDEKVAWTAQRAMGLELAGVASNAIIGRYYVGA